MRRFDYLAGLLAAFGLILVAVNPSPAAITYSYEVAAVQGGPAVNSASYTAGSNVALAVYLVETATNGSQSLLASEGGLFSGAFGATRISSVGGTTSLMAMQNNNLANTSGTNAFTGVNQNTNLTASVNSGGFAGGIAATSDQNQNGPNDLNAYLPAGVTTTSNTQIVVGQWAQPGSNTGLGNNYNGNGSSITHPDGQTTITKIFMSSIRFQSGSAGNVSTFVIGPKGGNDPITWYHQIPLANSLATGTLSNLDSSQLSPFTANPAYALPEGFTGTNAFAGYTITVTVNAVPEPSSMILGSIAVCGMGFGAYRRRMAKKNNPEAVVA